MSTRRKQRVNSNLRRCPLLKITKKEIKRDEQGQIVEEETVQEFQDCYKNFCMAWSPEKQCCAYFDFHSGEGDEEEEEAAEEADE